MKEEIKLLRTAESQLEKLSDCLGDISTLRTTISEFLNKNSDNAGCDSCETSDRAYEPKNCKDCEPDEEDGACPCHECGNYEECPDCGDVVGPGEECSCEEDDHEECPYCGDILPVGEYCNCDEEEDEYDEYEDEEYEDSDDTSVNDCSKQMNRMNPFDRTRYLQK